jgi:hypothetical protein
MFICLNMLYISLVTMDSSCKTYVKSDLASLHYVAFIEPIVICTMEVLSFHSDQFTNNAINKVIQDKISDPFILNQEHFFTTFLVYKKPYEFELEDLSHEVLQFLRIIKLVIKYL